MQFLQNIKQAIMQSLGSAKRTAGADAHQAASSAPKLNIRQYERMPDFENFEAKQIDLSEAIKGRAEFFKDQKIMGKEALASLLLQSNAEISGLNLEDKHSIASGWADGNKPRTFAAHLGVPNLIQHRLNKIGTLQTNTQLANTQIALCRIAAAGVSGEFLANFETTVKDCTPDNFGKVIAEVQQMALDAYLEPNN